MSSVRIRRAAERDLLPCARVFVASVEDLARRLGQPTAQRDPRMFAGRLAHLLRTDPAGFHVATRGGRVAAFASTILREDVHFLSMFWALPSFQEQGAGRELLRRAFEEPEAGPDAARCVYASLDSRAQRLYLELGMLPRTLVYALTGEPDPAARPDVRVELLPIGEPGTASPEAIGLAAKLDPEVRGCRRDVDHSFALALPGSRFFAARHRGKRVGYVALDAAGGIGPAAVVDPRFAPGIAWAALAAARDRGMTSVRMLVPGLNGGALAVALGSGLKIGFIGSWLAEREIGRFDSYLATYGDIF